MGPKKGEGAASLAERPLKPKSPGNLSGAQFRFYPLHGGVYMLTKSDGVVAALPRRHHNVPI